MTLLFCFIGDRLVSFGSYEVEEKPEEKQEEEKMKEEEVEEEEWDEEEGE